MVVGQNGEHIGADFVGRVSICGDAVGPGDDEVDFPGSEKAGGGGIGDGVEGDAVFEEFPGGELEALLAGAGFAGVDVLDLALGMGGADDAKSSTVTRSSEGASVADGQDGRAFGDEGCTVVADFEVHGEVFGIDLLGFGEDGLGALVGEVGDAVEGPEEVDGGGAAGGEALVGFVKVCAGLGGECHAVGGGNADGRGSTDGHVADGVADRFPGGEFEPRFVLGKFALVEKKEVALLPFEAADGHEAEGYLGVICGGEGLGLRGQFDVVGEDYVVIEGGGVRDGGL